MTRQEIDKAFINGTQVKTRFYTKSVLHYCGESKITDKQFRDFLKRFTGKYVIKNDFGGITTHYYIYKPE